MDSREEKLKKAAELYAKNEGESLLREAEEIRRQNVSYMTPRADRTVYDLMAAGRRANQRPKQRKALYGLCTAAACIVLTFIIISNVPGKGGSESEMVADSGTDAAAAEAPAAPMPAPELLPEPELPADILPISFELPADFRIENAELDNGMSVYNLQSDVYGNVVLTMYYKTAGEEAPGEDFFKGFDEVIIDGTAVPAKVRDTYKLLAFNFDRMFFTLSSEDDLGSLAAFYRNIEKYSRTT